MEISIFLHKSGSNFIFNLGLSIDKAYTEKLYAIFDDDTDMMDDYLTKVGITLYENKDEDIKFDILEFYTTRNHYHTLCAFSISLIDDKIIILPLELK